MKLVVTGGTGFTGKRVLSFLQSKNYQVRCLTRNKKHFSLIEHHGFEPFECDVKDLSQLKKAFDGFDYLINIISLGFGDANNILDAVESSSIKRAVFVSTTAIKTRLNAASKKVRLSAEARIKQSPVSWTILRPTMIFGGSDDRNIIRLIKFLKNIPIVPIPGNGEFLQQPVFVEDVAKACIDSLLSDKTIAKTYNLSGKYALSFNQLIKETSQALKVKRILIHVPVRPVLFILRFLEKFFSKPFLKEEQVLRLLEDKAFDYQLASKDFGYTPLGFREVIEKEVKLIS